MRNEERRDSNDNDPRRRDEFFLGSPLYAGRVNNGENKRRLGTLMPIEGYKGEINNETRHTLKVQTTIKSRFENSLHFIISLPEARKEEFLPSNLFEILVTRVRYVFYIDHGVVRVVTRSTVHSVLSVL